MLPWTGFSGSRLQLRHSISISASLKQKQHNGLASFSSHDLLVTTFLLSSLPWWAASFWQAGAVKLLFEPHLHLDLSWRWSQMHCDHLPEWFGSGTILSQNVYTCTFMWPSSIQLQSHHKEKSILLPGLKGTIKFCWGIQKVDDNGGLSVCLW